MREPGSNSIAAACGRDKAHTLRICVLLVSTAIAGCDGKGTPTAKTSNGATETPSVKSEPAKAAKTTSPSASANSPAFNVNVKPATPDELKAYIAKQTGKVVLVDFWATYCGPCRENFPHTLKLAESRAADGLVVVSMSMDSPEPDVQAKVTRFLAEQKSTVANFSNKLEDTDTAFEALAIAGGALPHYKVYGRDGKIAATFGGDPDHPFDQKDIDAAVQTALAKK